LNLENEFQVNEYLTLKLEDGETNIYVNGKEILQCSFLRITIPVEKISSFDELESIDHATIDLEIRRAMGKSIEAIEIPPEVKFWAQCSNLQVWYENDYNTRLLHRKIAFPLLKELAQVGDMKAKRVLKGEIIKRLESKSVLVILYLLEQEYLEFFNQQELQTLLPVLLNMCSVFTSVNLHRYVSKLMEIYNDKQIITSNLDTFANVTARLLDFFEKKIKDEELCPNWWGVDEYPVDDMFRYLLSTIKHTEILTNYLSRFEAIFKKLFNDIESDITKRFVQSDFAKLLESIKDTPLFKMYHSRIEKCFLEMLKLGTSDYYERNYPDVSDKYLDFSMLINSINNTDLFHKYYLIILSLFEKIPYPFHFCLIVTFYKFIHISEKKGLINQYQVQLETTYSNLLHSILKYCDLGNFSVMLDLMKNTWLLDKFLPSIKEMVREANSKRLVSELEKFLENKENNNGADDKFIKLDYFC
jgi:hypothetical protein